MGGEIRRQRIGNEVKCWANILIFLAQLVKVSHGLWTRRKATRCSDDPGTLLFFSVWVFGPFLLFADSTVPPQKKGSRRRLLRFYVYLVDTLVLVQLLRTRGAQLERMQVAIMELRNVKWEGAGGEAIKFNWFNSPHSKEKHWAVSNFMCSRLDRDH